MSHQSRPIFYYVYYTSPIYVRLHILRVWIQQRKVVSLALIFKHFIVKVFFSISKFPTILRLPSTGMSQSAV